MISFILQYPLLSLLTLGLFLELFYLKPKKLLGALLLTFIPTIILMIWFCIEFQSAYLAQNNSFGINLIEKLASQISKNAYLDIFLVIFPDKNVSLFSWYSLILVSFLFSSILLFSTMDGVAFKSFNILPRLFTFIIYFIFSAIGVFIFTLLFAFFALFIEFILTFSLDRYIAKNSLYNLVLAVPIVFLMSFSVAWIFQICGRWLLFYNLYAVIASFSLSNYNLSKFLDNLYQFTSSGILEFLEPDKTWKLFTVILVSVMSNFDLIKKYLPFKP